MSERIIGKRLSQKLDQVKSVLRISKIFNEIKGLLTTLLVIIFNLFVVFIDSLGNPVNEVKLFIVLIDNGVSFGLVSLTFL